MDLSKFLSETKYVDFSNPTIAEWAKILFSNAKNDTEKARLAFEFVRDEIPHSFDINAKIITARASDVLLHKTGICHAKSNLLAAFLRLEGIPAAFCYQHLTLADDDSLGYCLHCYNAVFVDNRWIKIDARGNTNGINAQFSLTEPILAFPIRKEYDEYYFRGIYANEHFNTMTMLENAKSLQDIIKNIPCKLIEPPDFAD